MFVRPDGTRVAGRIVVGAPEAVSETEARCPVALEGIGERVWWIHGASTLQALALGVRFLRELLAAEREHGLRVCFEERGGKLLDVPLAETLGGWGAEAERSGGQREQREQTGETEQKGQKGQRGQKGRKGQRGQKGQRGRTGQMRASAAGARAGARSGQPR